jgi:hypothetical protein
MTIDELIELAEGARADLCGHAQVRIAYQPSYPLRAVLHSVTIPPGAESSCLYGPGATAAGPESDGTFPWLATGDIPDGENPYAPLWSWHGF